MQPDAVVMDNFSTPYFATVANENLQAAIAVGSKDVQALGKISDSPSAILAVSNRKAEVNLEPALPVRRVVKGLGVARGEISNLQLRWGAPRCHIVA